MALPLFASLFLIVSPPYFFFHLLSFSVSRFPSCISSYQFLNHLFLLSLPLCSSLPPFLTPSTLFCILFYLSLLQPLFSLSFPFLSPCVPLRLLLPFLSPFPSLSSLFLFNPSVHVYSAFHFPSHPFILSAPSFSRLSPRFLLCILLSFYISPFSLLSSLFFFNPSNFFFLLPFSISSCHSLSAPSFSSSSVPLFLPPLCLLFLFYILLSVILSFASLPLPFLHPLFFLSLLPFCFSSSFPLLSPCFLIHLL